MNKFIVLVVLAGNVEVFKDDTGKTMIFDDGATMDHFARTHIKTVYAFVALNDDIYNMVSINRKLEKIIEKEGG